MKNNKIKILIIIALMMVAQFGNAQEVDSTNYLRALSIMKELDSNSYDILLKAGLEMNAFFLESEDEEEFIDNISTAVHESCHLMNARIGSRQNQGYYVAKNVHIEVPAVGIFRSSKANIYIPKEMKKESQRFAVYMKDASGDLHMSSLKNGIYGLLNEYTAYCHDVEADLVLSKSHNQKINDGWSTNIADSYFEFNVFIAAYLKYARLNEKEIYNRLLDNKNLIVAYTLVEKRFRKALEVIESSQKYIDYYSTESKEYLNVSFKNELKVLFNDKINESNYTSFLDASLLTQK